MNSASASCSRPLSVNVATPVRAATSSAPELSGSRSTRLANAGLAAIYSANLKPSGRWNPSGVAGVTAVGRADQEAQRHHADRRRGVRNHVAIPTTTSVKLPGLVDQSDRTDAVADRAGQVVAEPQPADLGENSARIRDAVLERLQQLLRREGDQAQRVVEAQRVLDIELADLARLLAGVGIGGGRKLLPAAPNDPIESRMPPPFLIEMIAFASDCLA